jgi:hypothetical protein
MSGQRIFRLGTIFAAACIVMSVAVAPAGAEQCGGRRPLHTFRVRVISKPRTQHPDETARVRIRVAREVRGEMLPAPEGTQVTVWLSQGTARNGVIANLDERGVAVAVAPLDAFEAGHVDVRAEAWSALGPEIPCWGENGEYGQTVELDFIRLLAH